MPTLRAEAISGKLPQCPSLMAERVTHQTFAIGTLESESRPLHGYGQGRATWVVIQQRADGAATRDAELLTATGRLGSIRTETRGTFPAFSIRRGGRGGAALKHPSPPD
jgi:hypothetical protein